MRKARKLFKVPVPDIPGVGFIKLLMLLKKPFIISGQAAGRGVAKYLKIYIIAPVLIKNLIFEEEIEIIYFSPDGVYKRAVGTNKQPCKHFFNDCLYFLFQPANPVT